MIIKKIKNLFKGTDTTGLEWDKKAVTEAQAVEFAWKHINPEPAKYEEEMSWNKQGTAEYDLAKNGCKISDRYRMGRETASDKKIADMISTHCTDTDLVLYRGVCDWVYNQMVENAKRFPECDLYEKGFMATSLVKGHASVASAMLRIYVPAGSNVVFLGNVNNELTTYYEVVIQRGAKLKIVSRDKDYINCLLMETA